MSAATSMAPGPDMPVTLKVNYNGSVQKLKLPLHDMVYPVLEQKIRAALAIPSDAQVLFERYSDSASVYVRLDQENPSIYKQLYRAAKAKSKLKLRLKTVEPEQKQIPKPATVEDDTEGATKEILTPVKKIAIHPKSSEETQREPVESDLTQRSSLRKDFEARLARLMEESGYPLPTAVDGGAAEDKLAPVAAPACSARNVASFPFRYNSRVAPNIAVSCNHCEKIVPTPDAHYHCSTCDDGDFDLCETCVSEGTTCYSPDHWLIKRTMVNGQMVNSVTETIAPKPRAKVPEFSFANVVSAPVRVQTKWPSVEMLSSRAAASVATAPMMPANAANTAVQNRRRICNSCVQDFPEVDCLHCSKCEDYDLCKACFSEEAHGHNPMHTFVPAVTGTIMPASIALKLPAGRNQAHHAICDGCDAFIYGVRHKCLDCPDWDYCSDCVQSAHMIHPKHRFAALAEPIADLQYTGVRPTHVGICCDGPLCSAGHSCPSYIRGIRYKCAVCDDLDFCSNCQASPANEHNKTHPLIMFKTPVRNVHVTTTGENEGKQMPAMGDRTRIFGPAPPSFPKLSATPKSKPVSPPAPAQVENFVAQEKGQPKEEDLRAVFVRDTVQDGTILPPSHVFEQTWVLRNEGQVAWPAGCFVKYTGGEDMVHVETTNSSGSPGPVSTSELNAASESTKCAVSLAPGEEFSFTVVLRTPSRAGRATSHWRLSTAEGMKFGHHLWCDVNVRVIKSDVSDNVPVEVKNESKTEPEAKAQEPTESQSHMVFPKLENESPMSSVHESAQSGIGKSVEDDDFEDCAEEEWDESDDGFMTDEEYDILDASDEELLEEQQKKLQK